MSRRNSEDGEMAQGFESGMILRVPQGAHVAFRYPFLFEIVSRRASAAGNYWFLVGWELDQGLCRVRQRGFWTTPLDVEVVRTIR
jgi:hypothetical protein